MKKVVFEVFGSVKKYDLCLFWHSFFLVFLSFFNFYVLFL